MAAQIKDNLCVCLKAVLRPVMRFCLRHSLKLQDILECCKVACLEAAEEEIKQSGEAVSVSRLSIMTGVHRPDVMRLYKSAETPEPKKNIITRIMGQWQSDKKFTTARGTPRTLEIEGKSSEFAKLVHAVSADLNPYTVLFELERQAVVERTSRGLVLKKQAHIPTGDLTEGFQFLSRDANDLIFAVEENLFGQADPPNLHMNTEYDNVSTRHLPEIRRWFLREGSAFHAKARRFLSQFDKDINKRLADNEPSARVAVCAFSRIENPLPNAEGKAAPPKKTKG